MTASPDDLLGSSSLFRTSLPELCARALQHMIDRRRCRGSREGAEPRGDSSCLEDPPEVIERQREGKLALEFAQALHEIRFGRVASPRFPCILDQAIKQLVRRFKKGWQDALRVSGRDAAKMRRKCDRGQKKVPVPRFPVQERDQLAMVGASFEKIVQNLLRDFL